MEQENDKSPTQSSKVSSSLISWHFSEKRLQFTRFLSHFHLDKPKTLLPSQSLFTLLLRQQKFQINAWLGVTGLLGESQQHVGSKQLKTNNLWWKKCGDAAIDSLQVVGVWTILLERKTCACMMMTIQICTRIVVTPDWYTWLTMSCTTLDVWKLYEKTAMIYLPNGVC